MLVGGEVDVLGEIGVVEDVQKVLGRSGGGVIKMKVEVAEEEDGW